MLTKAENFKVDWIYRIGGAGKNPCDTNNRNAFSGGEDLVRTSDVDDEKACLRVGIGRNSVVRYIRC
jgi:hypothetical protein